MLEELDSATTALQEALRRYREACSSIQKSYLESKTLDGIPPELSNRLTKELPLILSYETKIQEAKSAVSWARNCSSSIVPINILPAEVIARIFVLFVEINSCIVNSQTRGFNEDAEISFPNSKNPIILSHVCSRWREIAFNTRSIWSHIDLSPYPPITEKVVTRAAAYAERAGQSLLDVHIVDPTAYGGLPNNTRLFDLLASIASRIKSLKFETRHTSRSGEFCRIILQICFAFCVPGTLKQITLEGDPMNNNSFLIRPIDDPVPNDVSLRESILLDLPRGTIDTLLLAVPVLRLNGFFPFWTSKAYHDLSELCLGAKLGSIAESQLLTVLKGSPHLRVLKFDLHIDHQLPDDASITPVPLRDLEALIVCSVHEDSLARFLRLLEPGTKPLTLSLDRAAETLHFAHPEIQKFISRSNVVKLCATGFGGLGQVFELVGLAPNPRVLALHQFSSLTGLEDEDGELPEDYEIILPDTNICLEDLYLLDCGKWDPCYPEDLKDLIETYRVQRVIAWRCHFGEPKAFEQLAEVCPSVIVVPDDYPNPVGDWW
ncbi:hypothetical protein FRC11_000506 [Ceratobasidium sp. 423]|nr:hypothetical protein FRC11_000506 [Ceratobasidium sp. 423]